MDLQFTFRNTELKAAYDQALAARQKALEAGVPQG